jgi:hypothetical protein
MTDIDLGALRVPFAAEEIGKLPRVTCPDCSDRRKTCEKHQKSKCSVCGAYVSEKHIHIDYVGHADVTSRLLNVDPAWNWEPKAEDEHGLPVFDTDDSGVPVGLWIRLTVGGVSRLGYGSVPSGQPDAVKVLIGDALRNAAMRFGVALDLWAKGDRADPTAENATASAGRAAQRGRQGGGPQGRGQVSRPAPANPAVADANGEPVADEPAQDYAIKARDARTLAELEAIQKEARDAGKLAAFIRNPSSGGIGKLALYIEWRRKQLADVDRALKELDDAARAASMDIGDLEIHVRKVTGTSLEDATPAQIRQAAEALRGKAAALWRGSGRPSRRCVPTTPRAPARSSKPLAGRRPAAAARRSASGWTGRSPPTSRTRGPRSAGRRSTSTRARSSPRSSPVPGWRLRPNTGESPATPTFWSRMRSMTSRRPRWRTRSCGPRITRC